MDALTVDIMGLTFKVKADRIVHRIERESGMDRLAEKMAKAAGVVDRSTKLLEGHADALIAREDDFKLRADRSFGTAHAMLDSGEKGMDALDAKLALVTNDPLPVSGGSSNPPPLPNAGHPVMKNIHTNNGQ